MKRFAKVCYVVVNLPQTEIKEKSSYKSLVKGIDKNEKKVYIQAKACGYSHSGDDGKEVPPVPIPNTEVKLFYAESTCR